MDRADTDLWRHVAVRPGHRRTRSIEAVIRAGQCVLGYCVDRKPAWTAKYSGA